MLGLPNSSDLRRGVKREGTKVWSLVHLYIIRGLQHLCVRVLSSVHVTTRNPFFLFRFCCNFRLCPCGFYLLSFRPSLVQTLFHMESERKCIKHNTLKHIAHRQNHQSIGVVLSFFFSLNTLKKCCGQNKFWNHSLV